MRAPSQSLDGVTALVTTKVMMNAPTRRSPRVLIIHDGNSVDPYLAFLRKAGLEASEAHANEAVPQTLAMEPDIIVLDFDCDGEIVSALGDDARTSRVPIIALADLPEKTFGIALPFDRPRDVA